MRCGLEMSPAVRYRRNTARSLSHRSMPRTALVALILSTVCVTAPLRAQETFRPYAPAEAAVAEPPSFIQAVTKRYSFSGAGDLERTDAAEAIAPTARRADAAVWADAAPLLTNDVNPAAERPWTDDGFRRVARSKTGGGWGTHSARVELRERNLGLLDPAAPRTWETGEKLKMPVAGPLFAFAQLDAWTPSVEQQQHRWLGKYGVGVTLKPWVLDQEVSVRGGPAMRYDGTSAERSEVFVEAATKLPVPVLGALDVEWTGYAVPAATTAEPNVLNQDLRLAKPLGGGSEVYMGARYRWENAAGTTPWVDRAQLYLGLQLKR